MNDAIWWFGAYHLAVYLLAGAWITTIWVLGKSLHTSRGLGRVIFEFALSRAMRRHERHYRA